MKSTFDPKRISTKALHAADVPAPQREWLPNVNGSEDWTLINFANSFDGYEFLGDEPLGQLCNDVKKIFAGNPNVLETFNVTGLRMLPFFEQRRAKWGDLTLVDDFTNEVLKAISRRLTK